MADTKSTAITRRAFTVGAAAVPSVLATGAALAGTLNPAPALGVPNEANREELLSRYESWLFFERRVLLAEMYPDVPVDIRERGATVDDFAMMAIFPITGDWRDNPPSGRAKAILNAAGVSLEAEG